MSMTREERIARVQEVCRKLGQTAVAAACDVKQPSVAQWLTRGFPRTEWTGETDYATSIENLARKAGYPEITRAYLLGRSE